MIHVDIIHIYYEILFIHENEEILSFATTWTDGKGNILSEISQTRQIVHDPTCIWNLFKKEQGNS